MIVHSFSTGETEALGKRLGSQLQPNEVVAMFGDLGAGKTAFTRGVAEGMGITAPVSSPTFALVNEYRTGDKCLYHFDMYRINGWDDLYSTGYFDYLETGAVLLIEWSENIEAVLPESCIRVKLEKTEDENERVITVGRGENYEDFSC